MLQQNFTARDKSHAIEQVRELIAECRRGESDREADALFHNSLWGLGLEEEIKKEFGEAREIWAKELAERAKAAPRTEVAPAVEVKPKSLRRSIGKSDLFIWREPQPKEEKAEPTTEAKAEEEGKTETITTAKTAKAAVAEAAAKLVADFKFHPSDLAEPKAAPPTIEEKNRALEELADLWRTDPIAYAEKKHELAERLCTTVLAIDRAVKVVRDRREDAGEQSQATKLVAIGVGEGTRLWRSPDALSFASVRVGEHWENYRIGGTGFEEWLEFEYGKRNQTTAQDGRLMAQVPGAGAMRDAIAQVKGMAKFSGLTFQPAIRVGGDREVIWIDLGGEDWRAVKVTAEGWKPVAAPDVPFVRTGNLLALPEPVKGGSPEPFWQMINVREGDRVVVWGWMLQALNPVGPYPGLNPCGSSEDGKSTIAKMVRRTVDPNLAGLRRSSRKVEDVLIAANNGWVVNIDNLSWMTPEWSDTLCMVMTGISSGTRDQIPKLEVRRSERDLEREFVKIWPGVFGALLDALVAALRDSASVKVAKPARLMDFEQFAEAGCRVHFKEGEFVKAYAANRRGSMEASADASAVGRAVLALMKSDGVQKKIKEGKEGFAGQMSVLLTKLQNFRGNAGWQDWPKDAARLSTELSRVEKPLAALGIICLRHVDRRKEGGTQFDVVLRKEQNRL